MSLSLSGRVSGEEACSNRGVTQHEEQQEIREEIALLTQKKNDLQRMLSPSYDARRKLGETNEDARTSNEIKKEYYYYFQSVLQSATIRMAPGEKKKFRRQSCIFFQAVYDCCKKAVLSKMSDELNKAMDYMLKPKSSEMTEEEYDRQRACGLLLLSIKESIQEPVQATSSASASQDCFVSIDQIESCEQSDDGSQQSLQTKKEKLEQEVERLKRKQEQQLRCSGGAIPPGYLEQLEKNWSGYIEQMISILERLMVLPDRMPVIDEQKFYTYQQAYGLLLSTNSLILKDDHIKMIALDAHSKLEMAEDIDQTQCDRAVKLAWSMFKCVPPLVACQPAKFNIEWHETMPAYWADLDGSYSLIYYKPVLLFTPYGPVAEKGQVGRVKCEDGVNTTEDECTQDESNVGPTLSQQQLDTIINQPSNCSSTSDGSHGIPRQTVHDKSSFDSAVCCMNL